MVTTIGIDLGTTFSAISSVDEYGRPVILKNASGETLTPSVIYFGGSEIIIGSEAKEMQEFGEENVASFYKRNMGDPNFILHFNGKDYSAQDISTIFLKKLKKDAELALGKTFTKAVITVPAYFSNAQREATVKAGENAGLEVLRIINEPTAAAIAFGLNQRSNQTVLVYDLGGGTFDVTIIKITEKVIEVIGTDGNHELGGKNWDDRIVNFVAQKFEDEFGIDPLENNNTFNDLLVRAENAKRQLSSKKTARIVIAHDGEKGRYELSLELFEELTKDLLEQSQILTEQLIKEVNLDWSKIDGVLLVGGSTRMPMVSKWVSVMSGKEPLQGINVDEAVALGAAIQANLDANGANPLLGLRLGGRKIQDVMSHSLGMVAVNETNTKYINSVVLPKNKPIPYAENKEYDVQTSWGSNDKLEVFMLQGESINPLECIVLGKYVFSGVDGENEQSVKVNVKYAYNLNGIIEVEAKQKDKKEKLKLTVEPTPDKLDWLKESPKSKNQQSGKVPYTKFVGQNTIKGAVKDKYGNAKGNNYDLAKDGAFEGTQIAVLHLYTGEGFDFKYPKRALKEKGFKLHRWQNTPPNIKEFKQVLQESCQLWIISNSMQLLGMEHIKAIKHFFNAGKGLYLWGDNAPYYVDANMVAKSIFGIKMHGNVPGGQVIALQNKPNSPGFIPNHAITTGLENMYEGITIATIQSSVDFTPLIYGSGRNIVTSFYDTKGRRAIIDGGFTRLFCNWDTAGTARYVKNAAAWLVNYERFGEEVFDKKKNSFLNF